MKCWWSRPAIANLIRENKTYRIDSSIQTGGKDGMFLLDESLFRLWRNGLVEKEEALGKSQKPAELAARILHAERGEADEEEDQKTTRMRMRTTRMIARAASVAETDDDDD